MKAKFNVNLVFLGIIFISQLIFVNSLMAGILPPVRKSRVLAGQKMDMGME